ncbi:Uncharacterized conserved protein, DUF1697 family [Yoonia tamlensis]|uniref:Uncharacterized conserved protein, DUF1697 family n=1 Tax=Yoonia tamlensis TaxID=390270 RepID=A0A1I6G6W3_9RHOB|nr:DUF1697 domain-containing protein [Yoonia tamlensis]SFR37890.1 Uncharacterized conserved protein, DUF1697 family [Yoonia tamlensis]
MAQYIAFLRGINVGGHRKIPMADLRALCLKRAGVTAVRSYIASGNLVIDADRSGAELALEIQNAIADTFGFDVPIVVFDADAMRQVLANCPFPDGKGNQVHGFLCLDQPALDQGRIDALGRASEALVCVDRTVWVHTPEGVATSKLMAGMESCIGPATARNLNTLRKMVEMLDG